VIDVYSLPLVLLTFQAGQRTHGDRCSPLVLAQLHKMSMQQAGNVTVGVCRADLAYCVNNVVNVARALRNAHVDGHNAATLMAELAESVDAMMAEIERTAL
jgi:hypothetical protein